MHKVIKILVIPSLIFLTPHLSYSRNDELAEFGIGIATGMATGIATGVLAKKIYDIGHHEMGACIVSLAFQTIANGILAAEFNKNRYSGGELLMMTATLVAPMVGLVTMKKLKEEPSLKVKNESIFAVKNGAFFDLDPEEIEEILNKRHRKA
ncbi:MAG: hypothetical protein NTX86_00515 [Candidatus Dependentiae bacterium]|nr:hypothetical protein [Candidatus Dependentiae bacterium]